MKKRCFAFLLALLMLVPTALSCGKENTSDTTTTASNEASATTTPEATTTKDPNSDDLPDDLDYKGEEITILSRDRAWFDDEIMVEDLTGEVINDAIYTRNSAVEERLKVKIVNNTDPDITGYGITETIRTQVQAGSCDYDLFVNAAYGSARYTADNIFQNLNEVENLDLTKPYWSQGFNEALSIGEGQYLATGAICLSTYRLLFATFFNKNLFDEFQVPYLYETVNAGKFTMAYQKEISSVFYDDLNGNGTKDASDRFGFVTNHNCIGVDPYWSACELHILGKDSDNFFTWVLNIEQLSNATDKIIQLIHENEGAYAVAFKAGDLEQDTICRMFSEDRAAMVTLRLIHTESDDMRNMQSLYGIAPIPKLSEDQTDYYSSVHNNVSVYGIPLTVVGDELEMVGAFLEAMASESHRTVTPVYYELALKNKYVSDEESVEILDRIVNNVIIDSAFFYSSYIGAVHDVLRSQVGNNRNNVASAMKVVEKSGKKGLENLNNDMADLE